LSRHVARSSTTSDVFNAIAEAHRRDILDALITGEKTVGDVALQLGQGPDVPAKGGVR
jgi:hypothetical protein